MKFVCAYVSVCVCVRVHGCMCACAYACVSLDMWAHLMCCLCAAYTRYSLQFWLIWLQDCLYSLTVLCVQACVYVCFCIVCVFVWWTNRRATKAVLYCLQHRFDCLLEELYCAAMVVASWSWDGWKATVLADDLTGWGDTALLFLRWLTRLEEFLTSVHKGLMSVWTVYMLFPCLLPPPKAFMLG